MEDRRASKLGKVRALLARAAGSEFEAEADLCRQKANELMVEYQIEEFELAFKGEAARPEPTVRTTSLEWYSNYELPHDVRYGLMTIFRQTARFAKVLLAPSSEYTDGKRSIQVVGLPADVDYMELMFTSLFLECVMRMEPTADPNRAMIDNLVALKEVGHKWEYIGNKLYAIGQLDKPYTRNTGVRFTKLYSDYCKKHDRPQVKMSPEVFKRSFITGFVQGVYHKLNEMMIANDRDIESYGGQALVLRDARVDLQAFFESLFPPPPPPTPLTPEQQAKLDAEMRKPIRRRQYRTVTYSHAATAIGRAAGADAAVSARPGEGVTGAKKKELNG